MNTPALVLMAGTLLLVFVASITVHRPIRPPRRLGGPHEERLVRVLHRSLVVHLAVTAACLGAISAAGVLRWRGVLAWMVALALAAALGDRLGRASRRLSQALSPLVAPVDGVALLLEWALAALRRPGSGPVVPSPGSSAEAYEQVLELTQKTVERVMIPRSEVAWLYAKATGQEILETVRLRPHSHYPVFEGDFEQLVGTLDLVDLLVPHEASATAGSLARPAVIIPETIGCDDLLDRMQRDRFDAAIVIDEFGGMAGLVTLEDLVELVVGELVGEHEAVPVRIRRMEDGSYLVDGTVRIEEVEDLLGLSLPRGDYETLAGLFLQHEARIPIPGEKLSLGGLRLEVVEADARRIRKFRLVLVPSVTAGEGVRRLA